MSWLTKISGLDALGDLFGSFTGNTQKKYIKQGYNQAQNALAKGRQQADQYSNKAAGMYDPMVQQGNQAWDLYQGAMGLRGPDEARKSMDTIYNNPIFTNLNNRAQQDILAAYNARGSGTGGNALAASERALQDQMYRYLASIQGVGQRGDQGLSNQANIRLNQGNMAYGYGGTQAGMATNYGNAQAQAAGVLPNNVIGLTGAAMGGFPYASNNFNRYLG